MHGASGVVHPIGSDCRLIGGWDEVRFSTDVEGAMQPLKVIATAMVVAVSVSCTSNVDSTESGDATPPTTTAESSTDTTSVAPAQTWPTSRIHAAMFFDAASGRTLMVGGLSRMGRAIDLRDVWSYDAATNDWELLGEVEPFDAFDFGFDEQSGAVVASNLVPPETWTYDVAAGVWTKHERGLQPGQGRDDAPSFGMSMAYDRESDRIIAFGGGIPDQLYDDTWAFDADTATWERMQPAEVPPPRSMHAMTYDAQADRIVMWGGFFGDGDPDLDVWTYDYNRDTWESLANDDGPTQHFERHRMVTIPEQDRIVMFSGLINDDAVIGPETWSYELADNTWTQLDPPTSPPKLAMYAMTYDPTIDRVVIFGGESSGKYSGNLTSDVWLFDPATDDWEHRPAPE